MCGMCRKNVYNISDMTRKAAEAFLAENGTSQCMRFFRRHDGTIMTDNCPVGLRKIRNAIRLVARSVASIVGLALSTTLALARDESTTPAPSGQCASRTWLDIKPVTHSPNFQRSAIMGGAPAMAFGPRRLPPLAALISGSHALTSDEIYEENGK